MCSKFYSTGTRILFFFLVCRGARPPQFHCRRISGRVDVIFIYISEAFDTAKYSMYCTPCTTCEPTCRWKIARFVTYRVIKLSTIFMAPRMEFVAAFIQFSISLKKQYLFRSKFVSAVFPRVPELN